MGVLILSAVSVGFFHSLAPDHWLPFVALAKSSRWSIKKLGWITTLAGLAHVSSSLLIGFIGLWAGLAVQHLRGVEEWRGDIAIWLLIGFGVAYALWGIKHAQHSHPHISMHDAMKAYATKRVWMLFIVIVFGPCEPLIPLMFLSVRHGMLAVVLTGVIFSLVTIGMIVAQSCLGYAGVKLIQAPWMERYAHALAGITIVLTGVFVMLLGI